MCGVAPRGEESSVWVYMGGQYSCVCGLIIIMDGGMDGERERVREREDRETGREGGRDRGSRDREGGREGASSVFLCS